MTQSNDETLAIHENSLPRSVIAPLRDLRDREYLSEQDYTLMIKASAVAPQKNHLLGFCCAFLVMRMNNMPIVDTISMAYDLGEQINLTWIQKRWRNEHERLSRLSTLRVLLADHIAYELSKFDKLLPSRWPGYLIRNSRKLAFEGKRQNHCVASYQPGILSGRFAIATVFVDRTRFTVQLGIDASDESSPRLLVLQVRAANNASPANAHRERISQLLQIPEHVPDSHPASENKNTHVTDAQTLLPTLHQLGIEKIMAYYHGYGDSGNWDSIDWEPHEINIPDEFTVRLPLHRNVFVDGQWRQILEEQDVTLHEAIESIADKYLDHSQTSCDNGDGGSATLTIQVNENELEFNVDLNYTETNCEFMESVDLATGEIL